MFTWWDSLSMMARLHSCLSHEVFTGIFFMHSWRSLSPSHSVSKPSNSKNSSTVLESRAVNTEEANRNSSIPSNYNKRRILYRTVGGTVRGRSQMTSAKYSGFLTPSPPCQHFGPIYTTKIMQPPLLHQILGTPSLPLSADVICHL